MIGLIAGSGKLPCLFAKRVKEKKEKLVVVALKNEANPADYKFADKVYIERVENLSGQIKVFKKEKVRDAVMLGKIKKVNLFSGGIPDLRILKLFLLLKDRKDSTLLTAIIKEFARKGIRIISPLKYLRTEIPQRGVLTRRRPNKEEMENIKFGFPLAKKLADMDIGQTLVVKNKMVLVVEAIEGTNEAIRRSGKFTRGRGICIKAARTKQDFRMDIPVVGIETVKALKKAGITCLAIEADKMLMPGKEKVKNFADKKGISIIAL